MLDLIYVEKIIKYHLDLIVGSKGLNRNTYKIRLLRLNVASVGIN